MEWNQIEDKWTAMTRRVRADWRNDASVTCAPFTGRRPTTHLGTIDEHGPVTDRRRSDMTAEPVENSTN